MSADHSDLPIGARRVVGIETEFGISVVGQPHANPMLASARVVNAYATRPGGTVARVRWDYETERPLSDARGYDIARELADPSQLTDEMDDIAGNVVLTNGARLYVDHAHPEYSAPEVTTPRDAVRYARAGGVVAAEAVRLLAEAGDPINLYKNNTDGKGASYGTHENYLVARQVPFETIVRTITPFFCSRPVIAGAGRVGIGQESSAAGYQISSRADFFEREVGLETTLRRPIVNTRDEPHADPARYRRLHVIVGDATLSDVTTLLTVGTTSLVLTLLERGGTVEDLDLANPVAAHRAISHDPSLQTTVELADGRRMTALDLQSAYLERVAGMLDREVGSDRDEATAEVITRWEQALDGLRRDRDSMAAQIDWVGKLALLEQYRSRDGLAWDDPRLAAIDIQWSDVRPDKGLFLKLEAAGRFERLVSADDVARAVDTPPSDTRAWLRGRMVERWPEEVRLASWDSVVVKRSADAVPERMPLLLPLRATKADVEADIAASATVGELLDRLRL